MKSRLLAVIAALAWIVVLAASSALAQDGGQRTGGRGRGQEEVKSTAPFDPHNLSGVWILRTPYAGLNNQPPPFTPFGQEKYMANMPSYGPRAVPPALGNDVIGNCDPTGFPRNMFSPSRAVQFFQAANELVELFQYHAAWRQIFTDGRELPKGPEPTWYGYSVGKWDGDKLLVTTVGLNETSWLDHFGYPHSADMRVDEVYQRLDHDTFELVLTVDDPKTYTKPWVSEKKRFKLTPEQQLEEDYCVPSEEQKFNKRIRDLAGTGKSQ